MFLRWLGVIACVSACSIPDVSFTGLGDGGMNTLEVVTNAPDGVTVVEGTSQMFTLTLSRPPTGITILTLSSSDPDVVSVVPATIGFDQDNWNQAAMVTVTAGSDADAENAEATLQLASAATATLSVPVTVTDDEVLALATTPPTLDVSEGATAQVDVQLTAQPTSDVSVSATAGTGLIVPSTPLTFNASNWNVTQTVTVTAVQDANLIGEVSSLTLSAAGLANAVIAVSIADDDALGISPSTTTLGTLLEGSSTTFTVRLSHQPNATVMVDVASSLTSATASPSMLTFTTSDWDVPQTVTVSAPHDVNVADANVSVSLSATDLVTRNVSVAVDDDDTVAIVPSSPAVSVPEGLTNTFTVTLSHEPLADTTVMFATGSSSIAAVTSGNLLFTPANYVVPQTVTVSAPNDANVIANSTTLTLSSASASTATVSATSVDDDTQAIETDVASVLVYENSVGGAVSAIVKVRLAYQPAADTTVNVTSNDTVAVGRSPAMLLFTPVNYGTYQDVTVTALDDLDAANETTSITLSAPNITNKTVAVATDDNDTQSLVVSKATIPLREDGVTDTFTVRLNAEPQGNVTVDVMSGDPGAVTAAPTPLTFTIGNWNMPQTVTVTPVTDPDSTPESVVVSVTSSGLTAKEVTVSVDEQGTVNVNVAGTGLGTVLSNIAGISCPTDCVESYWSSQTIQLHASAAADSTFDTWNNCPSVSGPDNSICTLAGGTSTLVQAIFKCNSGSQTFTSVGQAPLTLPLCVTAIEIDAYGAQGGTAVNNVAQGGQGGRVQATVSVPPSASITVVVGGMGETFGGMQSLGGFNGGGNGRTSFESGNSGAGGGGASEVRINSSPVVIAGGGGGALECGAGGLAGAPGGSATGGDITQDCNVFNPIRLATGGTQAAGGVGGATNPTDPDNSSCTASNGSILQGGSGACAGGGGGGGWYGGGGGAYTAGAGGSSLAPAGATINTRGGNTGNGKVIISW